MQIKYGTYTTQLNEVDLSIQKRNVQTQSGQTQWATEETWVLNGLLSNRDGLGNSLKTKIESLEDAFSAEFKDLTLLQPDGSDSAHKIVSSDAIGGVRIIQPPHYTDSRGPQGNNYRRYTIVLQALIPVPTNELTTALDSFNEDIEIGGGGPIYGHIETLRGLPQRQTLRRFATATARQTGSAIGLYSRPLAADPIWPNFQVRAGVITKGTPRRTGNSYTHYPIAWQYEFEAPLPFTGNPHVAGVNYP